MVGQRGMVGQQSWLAYEASRRAQNCPEAPRTAWSVLDQPRRFQNYAGKLYQPILEFSMECKFTKKPLNVLEKGNFVIVHRRWGMPINTPLDIHLYRPL